ncbi:hypothetical protein MKW98_026812, partial [Papaver atlanticum]
KKVSEAKVKHQEAGTSGSKSTVVSEVQEDVLGANRKDGVRGYSSSMSKKQAQVTAVAYSSLQTRQSQNEEKMNTIQNEVTSLGSRMGGVEGAVGSTTNYFFLGILTEGRLINTMANPTDLFFWCLLAVGRLDRLCICLLCL